jgi:hypothetical protein
VRIVDCEQGSPEWFAARLGVATASDFDRIVTPKTGALSTQADGLISELIDEIQRPDADRGFKGNRHTERGKEFEPQAAAWYAFVTGYKLTPVGFMVDDDGLTGCSPDRLVGDDGGLEIKCPDGKTHVAYVRAALRGEGMPAEYRPQVHGTLARTRRKWWDFVSFCPEHKPLRIRVVPDAYTAKAAAALDEFCASYKRAKDEFFAWAAA